MSVVSSNWKQLLAKQTLEERKVVATKPTKATNTSTNGGATSNGVGARVRKHKRVDRTPAPPKAAAPKEPVLVALEDDKGGPLPTCVAMDCEMVGVGPAGAMSALARCSIVDFAGNVLYDKHVRPVEKVVDYRTAVSGIEPHHIHGPAAIDFKLCQIEVAAIINNRVLVGHALQHDLQALLLSHPRHLIRDTSRHKGLCPRKPRSLKALVSERLGIAIQSGKHDSVEDDRSVMAIYKQLRREWEKDLTLKHSKRSAIAASKQSRLTKKEANMMANDAAANAALDITNTNTSLSTTTHTNGNGTTGKRKRPSATTTSNGATHSSKVSSKKGKSSISSTNSTDSKTNKGSNSSNGAALKVTFSRPNKRPRATSSIKGTK